MNNIININVIIMKRVYMVIKNKYSLLIMKKNNNKIKKIIIYINKKYNNYNNILNKIKWKIWYKDHLNGTNLEKNL